MGSFGKTYAWEDLGSREFVQIVGLITNAIFLYNPIFHYDIFLVFTSNSTYGTIESSYVRTMHPRAAICLVCVVNYDLLMFTWL